jgi:ribosomal protein S25
MICDRCGSEVAAGEEIEHLGEKVCEDCYMDLRNPAKACDPWAVKLAVGEKGQDGQVELTEVQGKIVEELKKDKFVTPDDMAQRLGIEVKELKKEVATLRHMELVRGEKRGVVVYLTPFK